MEKKYIEDDILAGAKVLSSHHKESDIYIKEKDFIKILLPEYRTKEREETVKRLGEYINEECALPKYTIYQRNPEYSFLGLATPYYSDYIVLKRMIYRLSYSERIAIAKKISRLIESFEKEKLTYFDIHIANILVKGTDIKLVDMDSSEYRSIVGNLEYRKTLGLSCKYLSCFVISLMYGIDFDPHEYFLINNMSLFKRTANKNQIKIIAGAASDENKVFYPTEYIDSFTEEYITNTRPKLILTD